VPSLLLLFVVPGITVRAMMPSSLRGGWLPLCVHHLLLTVVVVP